MSGDGKLLHVELRKVSAWMQIGKAVISAMIAM